MAQITPFYDNSPVDFWTTLTRFFDARGRVSRSTFWLVSAFHGMLFTTAVYFAVAMPKNLTVFIITLAVVLFNSYCMPALVIKRLHDRDKSSMRHFCFGLIFITILALAESFNNYYVSLLGTNLFWGAVIWVILELGFLKGTTGSNKYGTDPLQQKTSQAEQNHHSSF